MKIGDCKRYFFLQRTFMPIVPQSLVKLWPILSVFWSIFNNIQGEVKHLSVRLTYVNSTRINMFSSEIAFKVLLCQLSFYLVETCNVESVSIIWRQNLSTFLVDHRRLKVSALSVLYSSEKWKILEIFSLHWIAS